MSPVQGSDKSAALAVLRRRGQLPEARQLLDQLAAAMPAHMRVLEEAHLALSAREAPGDILRALRTGCKAADLSAEQAVRYHMIEGVLRNRLGHFEKSIASFRKAEALLSNEPEQTTVHVDLLLEEAAVFVWRGRFDAAMPRYMQAIALALDADDSDGLALAWSAVGRLHLEEGRYSLADGYFTRASAVIRGWEGSREYLRLLKDLALARLRSGKAQACLEALASVPDHVWQRADPYLCFDMAGIRLLAAGQMKPDALMEDAVDAYAALGDGSRWQTALKAAVMGEFYVARMPEKAEALLQEALTAFEADGLALRCCNLCLMVADAQMALDQTPAAAVSLSRAAKIALETGFSHLLEEVTRRRIAHNLPNLPMEEKDRNVGDSFQSAQGGYVLMERLGQGAFGTVHRAYDVLREREVAIKQFDLDGVSDIARRDAVVTNIRQELMSAGQIDHPSVIKVLAVGADRLGNPYVVMPVIRGQSFRAALRTLGQNKLIAGLVEACRGVEAAHELTVYHRDLKPENIMLQEQGGAVVVDFGLASLPGDVLDKASASGTRPYMAPEHQKGAPASGAMDVFALGVTLYEVCLGRWPWDEEPPRGRWAYHMTFRKARRAMLAAGMSREMMSLISGMLAYRPSARPSLSDVIKVLSQA